jgi:CRP-like cAMP-binding protein
MPGAAVTFAIAMVMVSGFMNAPSFIAGRLIVQRNTPRDMRGRVASTMYVTRDVVYMLGMGLAALADYFPVQDVFFYSSVVLLLVAGVSFFLPGLGQPTAEWKRAIQLLRGAKAAPRLGVGRAATLADFDLLATRLPAFSALSVKERQNLAAQTLVADAPGGTIVIHKGEVSDNAYFILSGQAVAGYVEGDEYQLLEVLNPGDFFGEIAALTGRPRTANIITEEASTLLQVPAAALRGLTSHPQLNRVFLSKMTERMVRMNLLDLPRVGGIDQQTLRELRTPEPETQPA